MFLWKVEFFRKNNSAWHFVTASAKRVLIGTIPHNDKAYYSPDTRHSDPGPGRVLASTLTRDICRA